MWKMPQIYLLGYKNVNTKQGDFTMFSLLKKIFGSKPADAANEAPYKVEVPATPAPTPVAEKATEAAVKSVAKPAKKAAPKKPAAKKGPKKPKSKSQA